MPSYQLVYFNIRARAEVARMLFGVAGVEFEEERIEIADWAGRKGNTPSGQLPYLVIDGKKILTQSNAINRYLAKEFGFAGKTNWDQARADMAADTCEDMIKPVAPSLVFEKDPEKKKEMQRAYETEKLPGFMKNFEKMLTENGTGYFAGDSLTWADMSVMHFIQWISGPRLGITIPLEKYPNLQKFMKTMESNPKIKAYLDKRPQSDF